MICWRHLKKMMIDIFVFFHIKKKRTEQCPHFFMINICACDCGESFSRQPQPSSLYLFVEMSFAAIDRSVKAIPMPSVYDSSVLSSVVGEVTMRHPVEEIERNVSFIVFILLCIVVQLF